MGEVVQFPTRSLREWLAIQRTLREELEKLGVVADCVVEVLATMERVFERYSRDLSFSYQLPGGLTRVQVAEVQKALEEGVAEHTGKLHELMSEIFVERAALEVELWGLRHGQEPIK